jgi:glycosyltransferase involved in cell wall biosynthesis
VKILWVNANFLHPTTKGGQIRTLEMLKCLHQRHEIHYVAIENPNEPEGLARAHEYSAKAYPVRLNVPDKRSLAFLLQAAAGVLSSVPVAVSRWCSNDAKRLIADLLRKEKFDRAVCDFLVSSGHYPDLPGCVLFQHNVETVIWRRTAEHATGLKKWYMQLQAERMFNYERNVCREVGYTVAVSELDAKLMKEMFGVSNVAAIPTGVDLGYFQPQPSEPVADLVFIGSMDWRPNDDGVGWFAREILPILRKQRPDCKVAIVGRNPLPEMIALGDKHFLVTGTVPDVRPYLWGSKISIVPLRIGGGTRLKIYESMAAKIPVVSTTVGAEGLAYRDGENIAIADTPQAFADACLELLNNAQQRVKMADAAWEMVRSRFSWDQVTRDFEDLLVQAPAPTLR